MVAPDEWGWRVTATMRAVAGGWRRGVAAGWRRGSGGAGWAARVGRRGSRPRRAGGRRATRAAAAHMVVAAGGHVDGSALILPAAVR